MGKRIMIGLVALVISAFMSLPVFANSDQSEKEYRIFMPSIEFSPYFDTRDYTQNGGVVRAAWGCSLSVSLAERDKDGDEAVLDGSEGNGRLNDGERRVTNVSWEALLPDGTVTQPISMNEYGAGFQIPFEMKGKMIVRALHEGKVVAEFEVDVVGTDMHGKTIEGWRYSFQKKYFIENEKLKRGWFQDNGKWYFMNDDGVMQTGWQYVSYNGKKDWYYLSVEDSTEGKMCRGWNNIDGTWYYFRKDGTLASTEWFRGYWVSSDGSWRYKPKGSWKHNKNGWWFGDTSGWYARDEKMKINGILYTFDENGYLVE